MQDVVAVIGGEHRILGAHAHDVAERMLLPLEHAHRFGVADHLRAAVCVTVTSGEYGASRSSSLIQLDLAHEIGFGSAWRGVASIAMATRLIGVTAAAALMPHVMRRELADRLADPAGARSLVLEALALAPAGIVLASSSSSAMGSPEIHVHLAELAAQHRHERLEQPTRSPFASAARQLADVGSALDDALVAEIHRHEHTGRSARAGSCAPSSTACRCAARASSGAAAAALDEVFERMAARHHEAQILGEHHAYSASPLKLRRRKNAPPLRRKRPITGMLRLTPAATCGTAKPLR
jgi:hypothetical protein